MKRKLVSVCIPVYNGARTIAKTLDSVLRQTYSNIEIIVVDNCSEDDTVQIVRNYSDSRIRLYQNDSNLGLAGNLNQCLKYVSGEYIQYVCADDVLYPDCIYQKVRFIEKNANIAMVFSASEIIDASDTVLMERREFKKNCIADGKKLAKKSYYLKNLYGEPSNVLFRASLLDKAGKFADNICFTIDWDMWIRLSCMGQVGYINEVLMKYRISATNVTSSIKLWEFLKDDTTMMKNIKQYGCLPVHMWDHLIHHSMFICRMLARNVYMRLKCS